MRLCARRRPVTEPARRKFTWPTDGQIVLPVGCGSIGATPLPKMFVKAEWHEVRLDIDPNVEPDLIGNIVDMVAVGSGSVDAVWSSHNLEHVWDHEVPQALGEFLRVLRPGGTAYVQVPDLEAPARAILKGKLDGTLYESSAGPVRPLDMLYGFGPAIARGEHYMSHKCGFTRHTLARRMRDVGFATVDVVSRNMALWATATRARER
jgi:SAM-dependent methyltransferase